MFSGLVLISLTILQKYMTVIKETGKHGVSMDSFLSHGNTVKISPLRVLRCSHMAIMRDLHKPTLVLLQPFLEHVLKWILLQGCLHHKITNPHC